MLATDCWPVSNKCSTIHNELVCGLKAVPSHLMLNPILRIGYDGTWSAFVVKLGNPRQWVYLMPCTATSQIWAIGASGCDDTAQCQIARGGTFLANKSTTFESLGGYSLGLNRYLGLSGKGYYGLDAVQLA